MSKSNKIICRIQKCLVAIVMFSIAFVVKDITANAYSAHTQAEAIQWLESKLWTGIDADGAYGNQCVDLVVAYYDYMGVPRSSGNGADYTWNTIPSGWQRIQGAVPQPGDVLVYTGGYGGYGHVAIMGYNGASYHQNFDSHAYVEKITYSYNALSTPYWGVIRPDFGNSALTMHWEGENCQPSKNDVYVYMKANPYMTGTFTQAGITIWDSVGNVVGSKTEYINTTYSYLEIWYTVSSELGKTLKPGTNYTYQLYTVFNGTRYNSPVKSFTTLADNTNVLATPNLLSVTQSSGSVTVKCSAVSGATGYRFFRKTGNSSWEVMKDLTGTTFVDTNVQAGKTYTYTVRAYKDTLAMAKANQYSINYWSGYKEAGLSITYTGSTVGWIKDNVGWWYRRADGSYPCNGWAQISGEWYYFNASGYRVTGWCSVSGTWYFLDEDGVMQTGWTYDGNMLYYMENSGAMVSNRWIHTVGDKWYYMTSSGAAASGWEYIGGVWYAFNEDFQMITGWAYDGNVLYYMEQSGAMVSNKWIHTVSDKWYYMTSSGAAATGWASISGTWYYFDSEHVMVKGWRTIGGTKYYFNGSGAMVTGWQAIGGKWYYFHGSGAMAKNQWVGNYYLQADGTMATNKWIGQYYVGADGAWRP